MLQLISPEKRVAQIEARNLQVSYGSNLALNLPLLHCSGNIIGLIGHNGAGKSTLMKAILQLLPVDAGSLQVKWVGRGFNQTMSPKDDMAFCPETGSVFADITVKNYIQMWCRVRYSDANYFRDVGDQYMKLFDIYPLLHKLGRELSKGQRRRVQTMIGFLIDPKLFLIDEPFDGLDVEKTQELIDIVKTEAGRRSFIVSSHRMDVIERLADFVLVLQRGEIAAAGSVQEVCQKLSGANGESLSNSSLVDAMSLHLSSNKIPRSATASVRKT